jgi:hypothetical protein
LGTFEERKLRRFRFLKYLYERTNGNEAAHAEVAHHLAVPLQVYQEEFRFLAKQGLVDGTRGIVHLTHAGVVEIEAALSPSDQPTERLPVNIIHVEQMSNSQIQQGTVDSTQAGTFASLDLAAVAEFIRGVKAELPQLKLTDDDEAEVQSDIATIETQLSSPRPKVEIVKESLRSIRNIAEGTVGSLAASGIIAGIAKLLSM